MSCVFEAPLPPAAREDSTPDVEVFLEDDDATMPPAATGGAAGSNARARAAAGESGLEGVRIPWDEDVGASDTPSQAPHFPSGMMSMLMEGAKLMFKGDDTTDDIMGTERSSQSRDITGTSK